MGEHQQLTAIRRKIDEIDLRIHQLLNERATMAQAVAQIKIDGGEQGDFYRPDREAAILKQVITRNDGPLAASEVARLFREIMSACLAFEKPLQVAYLGAEGSYTHLATLKQFGGSADLVAMTTITEVFQAVEVGQVSYGVVPVENSTEGMVTHTLDRFMNSPLKINGEVLLPIHHYLLSRAGSIKLITEIYAHPQALAQCQKLAKKTLS